MLRRPSPSPMVNASSDAFFIPCIHRRRRLLRYGWTTRRSRGTPSPSPTMSPVISPPPVVPSPPSGGRISSIGLTELPSNFAASTSTSCQGRGKYKNMRFQLQIKAVGGHRIHVEIPPGFRRPVEGWATEFKTEVGIICQLRALLEARFFGEKFDIGIHLPHV